MRGRLVLLVAECREGPDVRKEEACELEERKPEERELEERELEERELEERELEERELEERLEERDEERDELRDDDDLEECELELRPFGGMTNPPLSRNIISVASNPFCNQYSRIPYGIPMILSKCRAICAILKKVFPSHHEWFIHIEKRKDMNKKIVTCLCTALLCAAVSAGSVFAEEYDSISASCIIPEEEPVQTEETAQEEEPVQTEEAVPEEQLERAAEPSVTYRTHVQTDGWEMNWSADGAMSGTQGQSKRLEGIEIKVQSDLDLGIRYMTHVQTYGWETAWSADGAMSGTQGQSKRLEAIRIELTGTDAPNYDVWYSVHAQHFGWLNWAKNGALAGTAGYSYRLEGIRIRILPKDSPAPAAEGSYAAAFFSSTEGPDSNTEVGGVLYNTHVQTYGWQDWVANGKTAGTSGESKRLEGLHVRLQNPPCSGSIEYRTHVQGIGWQDWVRDGALAGTTGQAKRLEAVQIRLTGEMAEKYDVWYRTHCQHFGWMGWAANGEQSGTEGFSYRMEAMEICLLPKGSAAPGSTSDPFRVATVRDLYPQACAVLDQVGWNLRAAFDWSVMDYVYTPGDASLGARYFANLGFQRHYGDCYVMAACLSEMAKALGYDAHCVYGGVKSNSRPGMNEIHGWVEIVIDGELYVMDPSFHQHGGGNGYLIHYGDKGTWVYVDYVRVN